MRPGNSGRRLRQIKGSQDIVLFKEEGDIYCLKKRKTERHREKHRERQRHVCTHQETGDRERESQDGVEGGQKWLGVGVVSS